MRQTSNGVKTDRKITISLASFVLAILVFVIFIIYPLFNEIKKGSADALTQKNTLAELETKTKNLQRFQAIYKSYEPNLEKIDTLLINPAEPINFIEFLEKAASQSQLSIEISPLAPAKIEEDPWPSMNFRLVLTGSFPDFLKFFEKLELSPYLLETLDLSMRRLHEWDIKAEKYKDFSVGDVNATLLIKTYSQ